MLIQSGGSHAGSLLRKRLPLKFCSTNVRLMTVISNMFSSSRSQSLSSMSSQSSLQPVGVIVGSTDRIYLSMVSSHRSFSSQSPRSDNDENDTTATTTPTDTASFLVRSRNRILSTIVSPQNQFYALIAGGSLAAYGISRAVLAFTSFFTHLTPTTVAKWGFYTGFGTATVLGGLVAVVADNLYIRADPVFRYCSRKVARDLNVQAALGDGLTPGDLRSYRLDAGRIEIVSSSSSGGGGDTAPTVVWRPPRIQMIFDVTATGPPYRTGLVTCEAIKTTNLQSNNNNSNTKKKGEGPFFFFSFLPQLQTTLLKVDYETGNEGEGGTTEGDETIFLVGNQEDLHRVSKRSGLSLHMLARAVHINKAAAQAKWKES